MCPPLASCAFETSELPVILSLEDHCSPKQQQQMAELLMKHLGPKLLTYEELCATGRPALLSPHDLKKRVIVKGKVKEAKVVTRRSFGWNVKGGVKQVQSGVRKMSGQVICLTESVRRLSCATGHELSESVRRFSGFPSHDAQSSSSAPQPIDVTTESAAGDFEEASKQVAFEKSFVAPTREAGSMASCGEVEVRIGGGRISADDATRTSNPADGRRSKLKIRTHELLASITTLRSTTVSVFLSSRYRDFLLTKGDLPITSISEDKLLDEVTPARFEHA